MNKPKVFDKVTYCWIGRTLVLSPKEHPLNSYEITEILLAISFLTKSKSLMFNLLSSGHLAIRDHYLLTGAVDFFPRNGGYDVFSKELTFEIRNPWNFVNFEEAVSNYLNLVGLGG